MTFHLAGGRAATVELPRVVLECDAPTCGAQFTARSVVVAKTRLASSGRGWGAGTREDRRDFCPEHVDARVAPAVPETVDVFNIRRYGVCSSTESGGWESHSDDHDRDAALALAAQIRAEGVEAHTFDWAGSDKGGTMLDADEHQRLTGGLLDLLEVAS